MRSVHIPNLPFERFVKVWDQYGAALRILSLHEISTRQLAQAEHHVERFYYLYGVALGGCNPQIPEKLPQEKWWHRYTLMLHLLRHCVSCTRQTGVPAASAAWIIERLMGRAIRQIKCRNRLAKALTNRLIWLEEDQVNNETWLKPDDSEQRLLDSPNCMIYDLKGSRATVQANDAQTIAFCERFKQKQSQPGLCIVQYDRLVMVAGCTIGSMRRFLRRGKQEDYRVDYNLWTTHGEGVRVEYFANVSGMMVMFGRRYTGLTQIGAWTYTSNGVSKILRCWSVEEVQRPLAVLELGGIVYLIPHYKTVNERMN